MRKFLPALLIFILTMQFSYGASFNNYIVKFKSTNSKISDQVLSSYNLKPLFKNLNQNPKFQDKLQGNIQQESFNTLNRYYQTYGIPSSATLESLKNSPEIESITPNYIFHVDAVNPPNDTLYPQQWALKQIGALNAWDSAAGKGIIIGLVDTGIDWLQPDLTNQLKINPKEDLNGNGTFEPWSNTEKVNGITGDLNGIDDDGNGFADDVIGYDFVDQSVVNFGDYSNPDPIPEDEGMHGTLVAGAMAAQTNNTTLVSGLAYNSKILMAKAFDATGNAESDDIAAAIIYCAMNGANVINMSFGEVWDAPVVHDAIKFAVSMGVTCVASSGNSNSTGTHYPSGYSETICAGGTNDQNERYASGNYGMMLDIAAPAQDIITTDIGGGYKTASGTSFAAPYVSAAVALLLEKHPDYKPAEVRSVLQSSAQSSYPGWTKDFGAGILDIASALKYPASANMSITFPPNEYSVKKSEINRLPIVGTIANPLFDSIAIKLGAGINPENFYFVANADKQTIDDTISVVNLLTALDSISAGPDSVYTFSGIYTLSVEIYLKNTKKINRNIYLYYLKDNHFAMNNLKSYSVWSNNRRAVTITAKTNIKSSFEVFYRVKGSSENYYHISEFDHQENLHRILIKEFLIPGETYSCIVRAITSGGDTIQKDLEFTVQDDYFSSANFITKNYNAPRLYLLNQIYDIYGNGKKAFAANDLSDLTIGKTVVYEFDGTNMVLKDSSTENSEGWIPVGIGDTNGDGIPDIFGVSSYNSAVTQGNSKGDNPLRNEIFKNDPGNTFWGELIYDLDGDGKEDLIGYKNDFNAKYFFAYKYSGGRYSQIARTYLPAEDSTTSLSRGSAVGDFDGDKIPELIHSNITGSIFAYKFRNNQFELQYANDSAYCYATQYITKLDIDGDGIPEILQGYTSDIADPTGGSQADYWTFKVIKYAGNNTYKTIWQDKFYGVRQGFTQGYAGFRNGVSAGDLNGDGADEIIISTFPNLYVFTMDKVSGKIKPFWYYPQTLSNTALVADFDGNGRNEIGISTFDATRFFEYSGSDAPIPPGNCDGWALDKSTALLTWSKTAEAEKYIISEIVPTDNGYVDYKIGETTSDSVQITNLDPNKFYYFAIASYNSARETKTGEYGSLIKVYTHDPAKALSINVIDSLSLKIKYSAPLPLTGIDPNLITITDEKNSSITSSGIQTGGDSTLIVRFSKPMIDSQYNLAVELFRDYYRSFIEPDTLQFKYDSPLAQKEIYLTRLELLGTNLVKIYFSDKVTKESAEIAENYVLKPRGFIAVASYDELDSAAVLLAMQFPFNQAIARGLDYTITAGNIISTNGAPITTGPGNTLGFTTTADNLKDAYISPNPIKLSENPQIHFLNITADTKITILTLDGIELRTLEETDKNGGLDWDGLDRWGNKLKEGIYLFRLEGKNTKGVQVPDELKKFVIVP